VPYMVECFLYDYGSKVAPRVTIVSKTEVIGDIGQQIERLFQSGWDDRSVAIVERVPAAAGDALQPVPSSVRIKKETANRVVVEAGIDEAGGYLVLLDSFSSDWRATVDGRGATIVRANGLFRAVRLNPGLHVVEFVYRPHAFLAGAAISAATVAILLGLLVFQGSSSRPLFGHFQPSDGRRSVLK